MDPNEGGTYGNCQKMKLFEELIKKASEDPEQLNAEEKKLFSAFSAYFGSAASIQFGNLNTGIQLPSTKQEHPKKRRKKKIIYEYEPLTKWPMKGEQHMKKVIHVQTAFLTQALAAAAIGNGKGFVLMVIPSMMQGEETVQGALLGSSDGERMGRCVFEITCTGFEKSETYYPTKSLMKVAATLAKVTDRIEIEVKESYLELSAEDGTSRVKVPLNTTDLMFDVPDEESKTAVFFNMKTDDFAKVIHCGAFPTLKAEQQFRAVYFR